MREAWRRSSPTWYLSLAILALVVLVLSPRGQAAIGDIIAWQNSAGVDMVRILSTGELRANRDVTLGDGPTRSITVAGKLYANDGITLGNASSDSITIQGALYANDNVTLGNAGTDSATITAKLYANDNVTLGNASSDTITMTGRVASDVLPATSSTYDLGADAQRWQDLWTSGIVTHSGAVNALDDVTLGVPGKDVAIDGLALFTNGIVLERVATATDYTIVAGGAHIVGVTDTSSARTVYLPDGTALDDGYVLSVVDESGAAGTNAITVEGFGAQTVNGAANKAINSNYGVLRLYWSGAAWFNW